MKLYVDIQKKLQEQHLTATFEIDRSTLGILGASGCGKSMLLKCIAGIETPDSGQIRLGEKILFDKEQGINLSPQKRKIGLSFQQYALFPHLTVYHNLAIITKNKQLVSDLLSVFHLESVKDQYPEKLSGGQQQRVALARMLVSEPELLMFDEPFSALDTSLKEELQLELQKHLASINGTVLIVSHSLDELYRLCPELMIMTNQTTLLGKTEELFKQSQTVEAARLTGCKNIFPIRRISPYEVQVIGWEVSLTVAFPVSEMAQFIGIRAHDFSLEAESEINQIPVTYIQNQQTPFEQNCWFIHNGERIWWKGSKQIDMSKTNKLSVAPSAIMPLI